MESFDWHPTGADIPIAVETSVSSLSLDALKALLYGRSGVPECRLVDIERRKLEVHTEPVAEGYRLIRIVDEHDEVAPGFAPYAPIHVFHLLPRNAC